MKKIIPFYVISESINEQTFAPYDVMPYLVGCYKETKKDKRPVTFEEFKKFVESKSMYMYWSRCQYEVILHSWPCGNVKQKIDVHWQLMMNINLVTEILMRNVLKEPKVKIS